jgi:hypothetical protein
VQLPAARGKIPDPDTLRAMQLMALTQFRRAPMPGIPPPPMPPTPPRKEPKAETPKAALNSGCLPLAHVLAGLPMLVARKKEFERLYKGLTFSDESLAIVGVALKLHIAGIVKAAVWYARHRNGEIRSAPTVVVDAPVARFAMLRAENAIIAQGVSPLRRMPDGEAWIERFRNEVIAGIASQVSGRRRDDLLTIPRDEEEQETAREDPRVMELLPPSTKTRAVTVDDIIAVLERARFRSPVALLQDRMLARVLRG